MSEIPKFEPSVVKRATAIVEQEVSLIRATPKTADVEHEFKDSVVEEGDGRHFTVNLDTPEKRRKWKEMKKPWNRRASEVLHTRNAGVERVTLRNRNGEKIEVNADQADHLGRDHGFRTKGTTITVPELPWKKEQA